MPTESTLTLVGREERIAKVKQVLEKAKKIMAKKEIKTQTIEEILADHVEHLRSIRAEEKRA